jgi:predicted dehydrogenase
MADKTYGFAIVGAGVIAPTHAKAIEAVPNAELRAVVDVVPAAAEKRAAEFGVPALTNLAEVLARPDIDVVNVCVPSGLHAEVGVQAANAGKHVVVEKPIDITLANADRLIEAGKRNHVKIAVISQHRFGPNMQRIREAIDSGRFGKIILGDAIIKWYRSQGYYDSGDWRGTWALDGGGALMNQGVHYVDLLQWAMGPVETITAKTATAAHTIEVEDLALAILRFASGAIGIIQGSTAVYPGLPERLEISGTEGTAILESGKMKVWEFKDEKGEVGAYGAKLKSGTSEEEEKKPSTASDPAALQASGHAKQIADLLDAIEHDREPALNAAEARKPLEVILGIYESARTGKEVTLPLAVR